MKRIIAIILVIACLAACLVACDNQASTNTEATKTGTADPTATATAPATDPTATATEPTSEPTAPATDPTAEPTEDHSAEDAALAAAKALFDAGDYSAAKAAYEAIGEYGNAQSMASVCEFKLSIADVKVGDYITFGRYEQDNVNNGKEPIEWRVLKVEDGKALLVSKYALFCPFSNAGGNEPGIFVWEKTDLRGTLNGSFYNDAFTAEEKLCIPLTHNTTAANPDYGRDGGPDTDDYVFCLSYEEVMTLFADDADRVCYMTDYARATMTVWASYSSAPIAHWWLRSPGSVGLCMMIVYPQGWAPTVGVPGDRYYFAVCRPAISITID